MRRRSFLNQVTTMAGATLAGVPQIMCSATTKYKMGLQLFSVRKALANDPLDTLKKVKKMGYEDLETYGFNPKTKKIYGFHIPEFKKVLDDLKLTTTSGHYGFSEYFDSSKDKLKWFVDQCRKKE